MRHEKKRHSGAHSRTAATLAVIGLALATGVGGHDTLAGVTGQGALALLALAGTARLARRGARDTRQRPSARRDHAWRAGEQSMTVALSVPPRDGAR